MEKENTITLTYETIKCLCTISFKLPVNKKEIIDSTIMELQIWLNNLLKGAI